MFSTELGPNILLDKVLEGLAADAGNQPAQHIGIAGVVVKVITGLTLEVGLDKVAEEFIRDHGAKPGFKGYGGFPNTLCFSVNEQVVHGIPTKKPLEDGDIVSVDCGTVLNGFCGDSAYTFEVGNVAPEVKELLRVTKESLYRGIEAAVSGNRTGHNIQKQC